MEGTSPKDDEAPPLPYESRPGGLAAPKGARPLDIDAEEDRMLVAARGAMYGQGLGLRHDTLSDSARKTIDSLVEKGYLEIKDGTFVRPTERGE